MKRIVILRVLITAVVGIAGYLLFWPVPIDPVAWNPPAPDTSGVYAENNELAKIERLPVNSLAPEDIAIDSQGRIYTGVIDGGHIYRLQSDGTRPEIFTQTYGRPLGMKFDQN